MPVPDPSTGPGYTGDWRRDVLDQLGVTPTANLGAALHLWAVSEGMPSWTFNWLAATDTRPGSRSYNSSGVQAYPSYATGVAVLVAKLGSATYAPILAALRTDDMADIYHAINTSPWCPACQAGAYPDALGVWVDRHPNAPAHPEPGSTPTPVPQSGPGSAPGTIIPVAGVSPAPQQTGESPDSWDADVTEVARMHHAHAVAASGHAMILDGLNWRP